jgi:nucleoside-diphosphate-sugar epimerase
MYNDRHMPGSPTRALVTGGGGFIGRAIVARLLARGSTVRVIGRRAYPDLERMGVEVVRGDIADPAAAARACDSIDAVHHVAACVELFHDRDELLRTNVEGTRNLLASATTSGVSRFVFTSSASVVFGDHDQEGIDESVPYPARFSSPYAETKAMAERLVLEADGAAGMRTVALRPHLVWGPGDTHFIPTLLERARAGRLVRVGDGVNKVDVTFIDNIAEAHLLAEEKLGDSGSAAAGRAFFISQGEPVNAWSFIGELVTRFGYAPPRRAISYRTARAIGASCELAWRVLRRPGLPPMTRFLAAQMAKSHYFDLTAARQVLGYRPPVSTAEGLDRLIAERRVA